MVLPKYNVTRLKAIIAAFPAVNPVILDGTERPILLIPNPGCLPPIPTLIPLSLSGSKPQFVGGLFGFGISPFLARLGVGKTTALASKRKDDWERNSKHAALFRKTCDGQGGEDLP
jgi:hypothetical protein